MAKYIRCSFVLSGPHMEALNSARNPMREALTAVGAFVFLFVKFVIVLILGLCTALGFYVLVSLPASAAPLVEWVQTVDGSDCTVTATPQQELSALEFYICPNGTSDEDCIAYGTTVASASCGTDPLTSTYDCSSGFRVYHPSQNVCKEGVDYDHTDSPEGFNWSNGSPDTFSYTTDDSDGALVCGGVDDCPVVDPPPDTTEWDNADPWQRFVLTFQLPIYLITLAVGVGAGKHL